MFEQVKTETATCKVWEVEEFAGDYAQLRREIFEERLNSLLLFSATLTQQVMNLRLRQMQTRKFLTKQENWEEQCCVR